MIVAKNVLNIKPQSEGRYRCVFNYVFDDGREINIKPSSVGADYQAVCEARADDVFAAMVQSDAEEAISLDLDDAYKYANRKDVILAWLEKGYAEYDPIASWFLLKPSVTRLLNAGITLQQLADYTGNPKSHYQAIYQKWLTLDANKLMMQEYKVLRESF